MIQFQTNKDDINVIPNLEMKAGKGGSYTNVVFMNYNYKWLKMIKYRKPSNDQGEVFWEKIRAVLKCNPFI